MAQGPDKEGTSCRSLQGEKSVGRRLSGCFKVCLIDLAGLFMPERVTSGAYCLRSAGGIENYFLT
ncbi:hypothetical protein AD948_03615 [Acetobacter senegalensis]|uniref:Uncharacterized protein n=1 Tax=Acetobacter senegalensis TaxID=446692 RepID=A0A149U6B3_9PROT|nr:hypothetical protein AD948_03615 [Acetobacter senegalensis]